MLKVQYCSDLHLEFPENKAYLQQHPIEAIGDVLILAGDIVPFAVLEKFDWFFDDLSQRFLHVYWIPRNHEYYYSDITQRSSSFQENIRPNVTLLNNQVVELDGYQFIFSTLWSKLSVANQWNIAQRMSDFQVIKKGNNKFSPADYNQLHAESYSFLKTALSNKNKDKISVVISHHVPTLFNYPEHYKGDALNEAFAVELFSLIETQGPNFWLFGHHHSNIPSFTIESTKLLTNQLGYVKYNEHTSFMVDAILQTQ